MSNSTKSTRTQIENLLVNLWEDGYKIGQNDQWNEDQTELEKAKSHSYEMGWNEGNRIGIEYQKEQSKRRES